MTLIKFLTIYLVLTINYFFSVTSYANQIDFKGSIVEASCDFNSTNIDCKAINNLTLNIKEKTGADIKELLTKNNEMAVLKLENINDDQHKVLIINYY